MPNDGTNQSEGYITSVLYITSMRQGFISLKDSNFCVTIVWVSIEFTSSYKVQKCITLLIFWDRLYSYNATKAITEMKEKR